MSTKSGNNGSFSYKLALWIGYIGFTVAGITVIMMTDESLKEMANFYFLIGVGLIVVSGTMHACRFVAEAITGLRKSWSRS